MLRRVRANAWPASLGAQRRLRGHPNRSASHRPLTATSGHRHREERYTRGLVGVGAYPRRGPDALFSKHSRPSGGRAVRSGEALVSWEARRGLGPTCHAIPEDGRLEAATISWAPVSICLFAVGATLGPLLDGIHGTVQLLDYEAARIDISGLHSSLWVPLLLGVFYTILGGLTNAGDALAADESTDAALTRCESGAYASLSVGVVGVLLELSAMMYKSGVPYSTIALVLAPLGVANWAVMDRTRQGFALCLLCAVAAPLSELFIVNYLGWWHYNAPDIFGAGGLPSWVPWCYFFYTPSITNLARWLNYKFTQ